MILKNIPNPTPINLTLDAATGLRAGDALHLTSALHANVKRMATLDGVFARNAKLRKIAVVVF